MTSLHKIVDACQDGTYAPLVARMPSGWAVMGVKQFLAGYCMLVPDPVVPSLNALDAEGRAQYLTDMARLGDAVIAATGAVRANYAIFGNQDPALHAHVVPRFNEEPDELRTNHPWAYNWAAAPEFDEAVHGALRDAIRSHLLTDKEP